MLESSVEGGGDAPLTSRPPPPDIKAFHSLILSYKKMTKQAPSRFVKNIDDIPKVPIHPTSARPFAICMAEKKLIGKFIGIWSSPRAMNQWLELN
jgi:hypothetical protein